MLFSFWEASASVNPANSDAPYFWEASTPVKPVNSDASISGETLGAFAGGIDN